MLPLRSGACIPAYFLRFFLPLLDRLIALRKKTRLSGSIAPADLKLGRNTVALSHP
jgi:hypothetical protein